jgi:hypothetical protein
MRDLLARAALEKALLRRHPELNDGALTFLVRAAAETSAFRYHLVTGTPLPLAEVVDLAEDSEVGRMLLRPTASEGGVTDQPDLGAMSPAERMTWARRQGQF